MSSITVLLTEGELGQEVVAVLAGWVVGGVCHEFLQVHGERAEDGATVQPAHYVTDAGAEPTDLFEWLAQDQRDVVRLITVHVLAGDEATAVPAGRTRQDVELAHVVRGQLGQGQRLAHLNLIIPAEGVEGQPSGLARADLNLNLVVASEDRAAPGTFARPLGAKGDDARRFATHAAVNVAAVGALWQQAEIGPFDDAAQGGVPEVRVIRSFLRLVDGPDPLPELVVMALNPTDATGARRWPVPSLSNVTDAGAAGPFLKQAYEDTLARGDRMFDYRPAPRRAPRPQQVVTLLMAIKLLFSFLWQRIRNIVPEKLARVEGAVIRRLNRLGQALVGDDSDLLVRFGGRLTVDDVASTPLDSGALVESALTVVDLVEGLERYLAPLQAEEWDQIRTAVLALVDGSTMPEGYSTPLVGDVRPVILDAGRLVVHPQTEPLGVTGAEAGRPGVGRITLSPFDPYASDQLIAHVESLPVADDETNRARQDLLQRLRGWRDRCGTTLLWRVGSHLGQQIDTCRLSLVRALEVLRQGNPRPNDDALAAEARRAFRWIMIALLGSVLLAVLAAVGLPAAGLATKATIPIVLAIVAAGIGAAIWRHLRYLHFEFRLRHQREQAVSQFLQATEDVEQCSRELIRLGSLYWQYERWAEITSHVLHRPWGDMPLTQPSKPTLEINDPPRSCRIGAAVLDADKLKPVAANLRLTVFIVGWLRNAYREAESFAAERIARDQAADRAPQVLDDRLQVSNGALDGFLTVLRRGDHWRATVRNREGDAEAELLRRRPSELFDQVVLPSGEVYPDRTAGEADPIDGLLEEILGTPDPRAPDPLGAFGGSLMADEGAAAVDRSLVGRPEALALAPKDRFERVDERTIAPSRVSGRMLFSVVRVDASERMAPEQLALFRTRPTPPPAPVPDPTGPAGGPSTVTGDGDDGPD